MNDPLDGYNPFSSPFALGQQSAHQPQVFNPFAGAEQPTKTTTLVKVLYKH